ncbi:beta-galactosidase GalA [Arcticibacter eurypsychrophilus]|uniref:beta-galactosidase GalA n=1 Tax=Arcticibacter eurypsychrophilus TaxID=1434752 RepID=UPI00084DF5B7|nr:beta-galactosidase GalA [Arcticibacter eurypsychrophilus]
MRTLTFTLLVFLCSSLTFAQPLNHLAGKREHISIDTAWRFAFGHPSDAKRDFNNGTSYFSYLAKAGYGDGAASADFDDRSWRKLNVPHDWAVEAGFSESASFSHGFKAIGMNFPENSVGWYRKKINIPEGDYGKRITITFDGVFRNAIVWVNGHYLGTEPSGYNAFEYDITDLLNYGGDNTIAVRVDASMEEGWFYEGAGIYRHVWLNKTNPVHIATNGTFITTNLKNDSASVTAKVNIKNEGKSNIHFTIEQKIYDREGHILATQQTSSAELAPYKGGEYVSQLMLAHPKLWSVDTPYLHHIVTTLLINNIPVDEYTTKFGIRTIRFDANTGFFLNGKRLAIKGTNNHQEHAGVGAAMPDELQYFRIAKLKEMGSNAYRCSHNPPTPELLDACDSLGMLVIDENRLMGINDYHLGNLKKLIERDRNHPSIISWSIGNEEWGIENNSTGARIATTMQAYVKSLDTTRAITAGFSGGWGQGLSAVVDLMGYNYIAQENPDAQHQKFPEQKGWGTEEGSTFSTRGVYVTNDSLHYKSAYDAKPRPSAYSIEEGWNYYAQRPFLAGMFIWTGFDYRGEPTPYKWPSVGSYFGMLDQCGFPKDDAWYLRSWWGNKPVLHLLPHWNWKGKEGQLIEVWAYSNCNEVELFLNGKSLGKKTMIKNSHLEWKVPFTAGILKAIGYSDGKKALTETVQTTGPQTEIKLTAHKNNIEADGKDISIITIAVVDKKNRQVPDANNEIHFSIEGPGKIIGVGNGNPTSLEPDQYTEKIQNLSIVDLKELPVSDTINRSEMKVDFDDNNWKKAFTGLADTSIKAWVYRGSINLTKDMANSWLTFFYNSIGREQSVYINGHLLAANLAYKKEGNVFSINKSMIKEGRNSITIITLPLKKIHDWDVLNTNPGLIQFKVPSAPWKRKLFNGLAQIIIQSENKRTGDIKVTATSSGLVKNTLVIRTN